MPTSPTRARPLRLAQKTEGKIRSQHHWAVLSPMASSSVNGRFTQSKVKSPRADCRAKTAGENTDQPHLCNRAARKLSCPAVPCLALRHKPRPATATPRARFHALPPSGRADELLQEVDPCPFATAEVRQRTPKTFGIGTNVDVPQLCRPGRVIRPAHCLGAGYLIRFFKKGAILRRGTFGDGGGKIAGITPEQSPKNSRINPMSDPARSPPGSPSRRPGESSAK